MQMMSDKAWKVCQSNGGINNEHPDHPKTVWIEDATHGHTIMGYWDWVTLRMEEEDEKP